MSTLVVVNAWTNLHNPAQYCHRVLAAPFLDEAALYFIPLVTPGFLADNGSEYISRKVAKLRQKFHIDMIKSRPHHSNDNALAEPKNGDIIRKHFGYGHILGYWAPKLNAFHQVHFNPSLNFHCPCFFPVPKIENKGKKLTFTKP